MRENIIRLIQDNRLICIVRGVYGEPCLKLAEALCRGGIRLLEVTFNQSRQEEREQTAETIRRLNTELGTQMAFGAGTVTSQEMVLAAKAAGASFIVSPDLNEEVVHLTREEGLVSIPGALTPTEIQRAHLSGADFVKVFPASLAGPAYIRDVTAPLSHIPLLAVGGVNAGNLLAFLQAGAVGAGIGGSLVNKAWIAAGEWSRITESAKEMCDIIRHFDESRKK